MSKLRILIDEGHGGSDSGAVSNGLREKDCNLAVAKAAKTHLEKLLSNVEVGFTRGSDKTLEPQQRLAAVRSFNPTILIVVHHNSFSSPTAKGREVFYPNNDPKGKELAELIGKKTKEEDKVTWRGAKTRLNSSGKDYFYMLRDTVAPNRVAVFFEGAFLSNANDAAYLKSGGLEAQGKLIAEAVAEYAIKHKMAKAAPKKKPKPPTLIEYAELDFFGKEEDGWFLNGVAYIPARMAAEHLGLKVHFVSKDKPIKIRK